MNGRHREALKKALDRLDEAFQKGTIDAATLIVLQCPVFTRADRHS